MSGWQTDLCLVQGGAYGIPALCCGQKGTWQGFVYRRTALSCSRRICSSSGVPSRTPSSNNGCS